MASKNSVKAYVKNGYYHIYNRGVEKRNIFEDEQDYEVFLSYLKTYLSSKNLEKLQEKLSDPLISYKERGRILKLIRLNNFEGEIDLLAYCLMPNHFHLLIKQTSTNSIDSFINSLSTRYVMYFNKKYKRVGPLYQDVYKAVLVKNDNQLLYLSAYIHKNPAKLVSPSKFNNNPLQILLYMQPSSFKEYLGIENTSWLNPEVILSFFSQTDNLASYEKFVIGYNSLKSPVGNLLIEEDV